MLSIIIPTLNEEKYLPTFLAQIGKQQFRDYEIIVADAGSNDQTLKVAENFGCRVTTGGLPAKGRNQGAKIAKGELLLFTDADNVYFSETFLGRSLEEFQKRNLGAAGFPLFVEGAKFDELAYGVYNFWARLTEKFLAHASNTVLVKKEVHQKINGFDEEIKVAEEFDYIRRAARVDRFGLIDQPVWTSSRRLEADGRFKTYAKFLLIELWTLFAPIKSDIFKYRFDYSKN